MLTCRGLRTLGSGRRARASRRRFACQMLHGEATMVESAHATIELPEEFLEQVVDAAVRRVLAEQQPASRWLCGAEAASRYLDWPTARVYKRLGSLPHSRDGRLLMFSTAQLDRFLAEEYEGPARFDPSLEIRAHPGFGGDPSR